MQIDNEILIMGILIGAIIGFIIGFISGLLTTKKITLKKQEVFGAVFFVIWVVMHIYGFIHKLEVPLIFDIVGGASAGMVLGLEVSDGLTKVLLSKIGKGKNK